MRTRWRGRTAVPAIIVVAVVATALAAGAIGGSSAAVRVSLPDGTEIAHVPLPSDGAVALRYRNSLYGTMAEERFVATGGHLQLVELRAEQLAVLEEYYAIDTPAQPAGGDLAWSGRPAHAPSIRTLRVAATDRGQRTLHVTGHEPIELWRYVEDAAPSVLVEVVP